MEDQMEEEYGLNKRQRNNVAEIVPVHSIQNSFLAEPSPPLGLHLTITPYLIRLIQTKLSPQHFASSSYTTSNISHETGKKKDLKSTNKLKSSNFHACLLTIGSWAFASTYEGDLVAKCYYAKRKLIWEILVDGLKSKIEIQWSDITAIKATYSDDMETLEIVLARRPLFFREINTQPRKHTAWQASSDFTGGVASIYWRHLLKCLPGKLKKPFEMLIQCDPRLKSLSQQSEIIPKSPYLDQQSYVSEVNDESNRRQGCEDVKVGFNSNLNVLQQDNGLASTSASASYINEISALAPTAHIPPMEKISPGSAIVTHCADDFISMSDFNLSGEDHISGNPRFEIDPPTRELTLEELVQCVLDESQLVLASDEQSLMLNMDSLHCLIQQEVSVVDVNDSSDNKFILEKVQQSCRNQSQLNSASNEQPLMSNIDPLCCLIQQENPVVDVDDYSGNKISVEVVQQSLLNQSQLNLASNEQPLMSNIDPLCCLIQQENPVVDVDDYSGNKFPVEVVQQSLLNQSQLNVASDEQPLMSNVDSFCSLREQEGTVVDADNSEERYGELLTIWLEFDRCQNY